MPQPIIVEDVYSDDSSVDEEEGVVVNGSQDESSEEDYFEEEEEEDDDDDGEEDDDHFSYQDEDLYYSEEDEEQGDNSSSREESSEEGDYRSQSSSNQESSTGEGDWRRQSSQDSQDRPTPKPDPPNANESRIRRPKNTPRSKSSKSRKPPTPPPEEEPETPKNFNKKSLRCFMMEFLGLILLIITLAVGLGVGLKKTKPQIDYSNPTNAPSASPTTQRMLCNETTEAYYNFTFWVEDGAILEDWLESYVAEAYETTLLNAPPNIDDAEYNCTPALLNVSQLDTTTVEYQRRKLVRDLQAQQEEGKPTNNNTAQRPVSVSFRITSFQPIGGLNISNEVLVEALNQELADANIEVSVENVTVMTDLPPPETFPPSPPPATGDEDEVDKDLTNDANVTIVDDDADTFISDQDESNTTTPTNSTSMPVLDDEAVINATYNDNDLFLNLTTNGTTYDEEDGVDVFAADEEETDTTTATPEMTSMPVRDEAIGLANLTNATYKDNDNMLNGTTLPPDTMEETPYDRDTTRMDPFDSGCDFTNQIQPHVTLQCHCNGAITFVVEDVEDMYYLLKEGTVHSEIYMSQEEKFANLPVTSCDPHNQALLWLASGPKSNRQQGRNLTQRYALATIYFALNGTQWETKNDQDPSGNGQKTEWLSPDVSECEWMGVECDGASQQVTGLSVDTANVMGEVSAEFV